MVLPLIFGMGLPALAGAGAFGTGALATALGGTMGAALGSGLGSFLETGDLGSAITTGALGAAGGALMGGMGGGAAGAAGAAAPAAATATNALGQTLNVPQMLQAAPAAASAGAAGAAGATPFLQTGLGQGALTAMQPNVMRTALASQVVAPPPTMGAPGPSQREDIPPLPSLQQRWNPVTRRFEIDPNVRTPYSNPQTARGGGLMSLRTGNVPMRMQEGGQVERMMDERGMNEKDLITNAIRAIRGASEQPEIDLAMFVQMYGEDALRDLVDRVQSGEFDETVSNGEGMVRGPGDGMDDRVPASIEGQDDVLLADNEYIVPADVVSGLGNGSSDAGARELDRMLERVRMARTGTPEQAPQIDRQAMMPA